MGGFPNSSRGLGPLDEEALNLINAGTSVNTQGTYQTALSSYQAFALEYGISPNDISLGNLIHYVAYLSARNKSYNTIATYVNGLAYYLKLRNKQDVTSSFIIKKMLDGAKFKSQRPDIRTPITPSMLVQLVKLADVGCSTYYEAVLFKNVFLMAFSCFLRISEFCVGSNASKMDSHKVLGISDIHITQQGELQINIRYSKTDQQGKGTILCVEKSSNQYCIVTATQNYLAMRPKCEGPLFVHYNCLPLTRYQFNAVLKRLLSLGGVQGVVRSHSFRIGAATYWSQKVPDHKIKEMGRWSQSSTNHKRYIRVPRVQIGIPELE